MCSDPMSESEPPAAIATVTSKEGLWVALSQPGVEIIEVRHHLDLTSDFGRPSYIPHNRPSKSLRMMQVCPTSSICIDMLVLKHTHADLGISCE